MRDRPDRSAADGHQPAPRRAPSEPPSGLTQRQRQILDMIRRTVQQRGYPPSVREIGEAVGLRSPSSVHSQLAALERGGHLRRDPSRPRAIELRPAAGSEGGVGVGSTGQPSGQPSESAELAPATGQSARRSNGPRRIAQQEDAAPTAPGQAVPLLGEIAAGAPLIAEEHIEDTYTLPRDLVGRGTLFMLRVRGESMVQAGVLPGDLVVVRQQPTVEQGEMCAAMIDGEATVKFFRRARSGEVFLDPANDGYEPIPVARDADAAVLGKVVSVLRSL